MASKKTPKTPKGATKKCKKKGMRYSPARKTCYRPCSKSPGKVYVASLNKCKKICPPGTKRSKSGACIKRKKK
jgi:hypothetical protein